MGSNFVPKTDPVTGELLQTLINGAHIATNTLTGSQINTKGLKAEDAVNLLMNRAKKSED